LGREGKKLWSAEDVKMRMAVLDTGYRFKHDPNIVAWHRLPAARLTLGYFSSLMYWNGRSFSRLEHRSLRHAWFRAARFVMSRAMRCLKELFQQMKRLAAHTEPETIQESSDPAVTREGLLRLYEIGWQDEKILKFLFPWRR